MRSLIIVAAMSAACMSPAAAVLLPARTLTCTLGRATNLDATREQSAAEIVTEGRHPFTLFLPPIPVRTAPPPDAVSAAEPVDPRTRIVADPDGLTKGFPPRFDRVVDYWPERVEMTTTIMDPMVNLIIVHPIDEATGTAQMFMTRATDVATFDMEKVYIGSCKITIGASPDAKR